ncbi:hypothetical protein BG015_011562 [Linnemannia schmuckeri]|uniref:Uncharacterized protein n=1 Tax=Linnemannia schmuckeri TaxID=64567 RepID=A0A9P5RSW1_9FUNG|nr:hypothetical protein BG015_011562 [Linnemannia schmuckeri]
MRTMLAPQDPPTSASTPGSSSDALMQSHSQSTSSIRAPQEANYQLDDNSRASTAVAASPQHITDGCAMPSIHTADSSPYRESSAVRNTHVQSTEYSSSVSHPQPYSSALSSNYIPPPSPTPSQLHAYSVPEGHQENQHVYQDPYQQTYQQTYQQSYQHQPYPEPTLHAYPAPAIVDTVDEKVDQASSMAKPTSNGDRKKII